MRPSRFTIPTRIFLAFAGVLVAFGIVAGASLLAHERTADTLRLLDEAYVPLVLAVGEAKANASNVQIMTDYVLTDAVRTRIYVATGDQLIRAQIANARRAIERARQLEPSDRDRALLEEVDRSLAGVQADNEETQALFRRLFTAIGHEDRAEAEGLHGQIVTRLGEIARALLRVGNRLRQRIAEVSRSAAEQEQRSVTELALLALLALAAGLFVTWWSQRLLAPLPRLQERVVAVARGDLAARLEVRREDEIGRLAQEFERMVDAIAARDESLRELQRIQERIVASLRSAVVVIDPGGVVRAANAAAGEVLGIERDALDRPLASTGLISAGGGARLEGLDDAIESVATGGDAVTMRAVTMKAAPPRPAPAPGEAGPERQVDVLVTPFGDERGPRRAVLVVADDVTVELATKARLIQTERLAAIGKMAALVTHEVRNPLSSIGLNVEVLSEEIGSTAPAVQAPLRAIQREIDRLTGITEEYLRLARLPAPRLEPEDLGAVLTEVARFVDREMKSAGCTLELRVEPGLPLVAVDEAQIRQALLNLLRNAREAMPRGGEITVSATRVEGGVEIEVRDRGEGIPPERKAKLFDLFHSTKERGTGLGLPLTQQIVVAHRGVIRCEDAPGGGTVFRMTFPSGDGDPGAEDASDRAA